MDAKVFLRLAVGLFLVTELALVNCQSQVPVVTTLVPTVVNEGGNVTLKTVLNVTLGNRTCKPQDLQIIGGMYSPKVLLADFTNLFVDDYRLHVSLDTSDEHIWVYNFTVSCVTRLDNGHLLIFGGSWDCPGVTVLQQCIGYPIEVDFSYTDALPVCASQPIPTGANATAPGERSLPRRRGRGYNTVADIVRGVPGLKSSANVPEKLCHFFNENDDKHKI